MAYARRRWRAQDEHAVGIPVAESQLFTHVNPFGLGNGRQELEHLSKKSPVCSPLDLLPNPETFGQR